jgi:hypothetical protein
MRGGTRWFCGVLFATLTFAGETMNVSVCPVGRVGAKAVAGAEAEAAALFRGVDVEIVWRNCEEAPIGQEASDQHWFTMRLRDDGPAVEPEVPSTDTLGEAFFSDSGGYVADVYYRETRKLASRTAIEPAILLAYVMAHELGHLLLGPAHSPSGIMRAAWDDRDLEAIRMGWLQFGRAEIARIHKVLQSSPAANPPSVAS